MVTAARPCECSQVHRLVLMHLADRLSANPFVSFSHVPQTTRLTKGVSIDDYSTFRATRFSEAGLRERIWGVFHATEGRMLFATGTKGGCGIKSCGGVAAPHSLNSFVFCGLLRLFGFQNDDPEKFGETIATPPQKGGSY